MDWIAIDGSQGEGGGQILRSALTLSLLTGRPVHLFNIRARRSKPGLRPQHLAAVRAARRISNARVEGDEIGSRELRFRPGAVQPGRYHFDIGTAGSTSLVLQTVFLPLTRAGKRSQVTIIGGTHVPKSPCFHFLAWNWLTVLHTLGFDAIIEMDRAGFFPRGGGQIRATISPSKHIAPLVWLSRGRLLQVRGLSAAANLPEHVARRQRQRAVARLGARYPLNDIRKAALPAMGKGSVMLLLAECEHGRGCHFALGAPGKPAEVVADEAAEAMTEFLESDGCVDRFLADQLLLPLALAEGESRFRTERVTRHLLTNAAVLNAFGLAQVDIRGELGAPAEVRVQPQTL